MKVLIIGGVAGGATAAARIRRLDEKAEIIILERSGYISYANCGLPYYIGGIIEDREELTLQTPESFFKRFNIKARVYNEALKINTGEKSVTVKNLLSGEIYTEFYDKLLLSPGAKPFIPDIPGIDGDRIFTLRTVEDTFRIRDYVTENRPSSAVICGGGFIGVETAENLKELGLDVTLVQSRNHLLNSLDGDMSSIVHSKLRKEGINLIFNNKAVAVKDIEDKKLCVLSDGTEISSDIIIFASGVRPETSLAEDAKIKTGIKGAICVNEKMETNIKDIYAVGDAVEIINSVTGKKAHIPLAAPANKQGRIAADNICGIESSYKGSVASSVIKIFDITAASTGLTEQKALDEGYDCDYVILSPASHASYYPGAKTLTIKLVFEKNTFKILGAQIIGHEGADKRIDVIATAMQAGLKAYELKDLDLAYAPPYSSAKDPVNMAGFMADNIRNGILKQFYFKDIESLQKRDDVTLLDTRTVNEYMRGHAASFINIPVDELRERLSELDRTKPVYVMCQSGLRSYIACRILSQNGFDAYNFAGGYRFYSAVSLETAASETAKPCGAEI